MPEADEPSRAFLSPQWLYRSDPCTLSGVKFHVPVTPPHHYSRLVSPDAPSPLPHHFPTAAAHATPRSRRLCVLVTPISCTKCKCESKKNTFKFRKVVQHVQMTRQRHDMHTKVIVHRFYFYTSHNRRKRPSQYTVRI